MIVSFSDDRKIGSFSSILSQCYGLTVAPSQGRGLKLRYLHQINNTAHVAPSQGRGLKPDDNNMSAPLLRVAPSQGRGLKPQPRIEGDSGLRRPFTGAWIETNL